MTKDKTKKAHVRARMARTGESYQSAQRATSARAEVAQRKAEAEARIGAVFAGRYKLLRVVASPCTPLAGEGADAPPYVSYETTHMLLGGGSTIKLLPAVATESMPHLRAWLLREGRALRRAKHPGVIEVLDIGESDAAEVYLVLESPWGQPLSTFLERERPSDAIAREIVRGIAEVLDVVHERGVVHRALRNNAVHIAEEKGKISLKLSCFDQAALRGEPRLSPPGGRSGYPAWMSPEQIHGDDVDPRSDLYTLGIILYSVLTGRLPFGVRARHRSEAPPIRTGGERISPLDAICTKLLSSLPGDRYPNARALLDALARATI